MRALILSVLLMGVPGVGAGLAAELRNADFEEPVERATHTLGWNWWGNGFNRVQGRLFGMDHVSAMHYRIPPDEAYSGLWQDATGVRAGRHYAVTVYARLVGRMSGAVEVRLEGRVGGHQSVIHSRRYPLQGIARYADWNRLSVCGTAPTDALRVLVIVHPERTSGRGGALFLDKVELEEIAFPESLL